ncbi:glutamine synthetase family protein [Arthrobacter crystallopoietes]|uniref:glutamine synthetase family protein n=1 Tax=Crystallibacter crystallopoietes TaxID=37928 RepID=UPI001486C679|nr:glutamine synthetase family protein [Arthrobacter crystallopoietes]
MPEIPSIPTNRHEFESWCLSNNIKAIVAGSSDTNSTWIGKRMSLAEFLNQYDRHGIAFCDVFWVMSRDGLETIEPPEGTDTYFPTKENGYPDILFRPDLSTARLLSWHEATVAVNGTYHLQNGAPVPISPRNILKAQVDRAAGLGIETKFATEFEFYVMNGTPETLRGNGYALNPLSSRPYTYHVYRSSMDQEFLSRWSEHLGNAGVYVESLNPETGPGQYEINTRYTDAMAAGDEAFMYKNAIKELAALDGKTASFMALPRAAWAGSSCHLHQSLWSTLTGDPLFAEESRDLRLSKTGANYIAGVLATLQEFAPLYWPTINSYRRARPYSWAATTQTWGYDNRSTALRVVGEDRHSFRLENRMGGADVNPYIAIAASLAGGLYGIENKLDAPAHYPGDAYADPSLKKLPQNLGTALNLFEESAIAREYLGDDFVNHYTAMKRSEIAQAEAHVSDWEVTTYIETA